MRDKPRRFWQIHLSTALIMMLVASLEAAVFAWLLERSDMREGSGFAVAALKLTPVLCLMFAVTVCFGALVENFARRRSKP